MALLARFHRQNTTSVENRVWRFWLEPAGLTLQRRKTGHIPSRHNSYSANPKDDDKEKAKRNYN
jgi:hypothetical protein